MASRDEHEIHSTLNVSTTTEANWETDHDMAYQYKGKDWMTYLRGMWNVRNNMDPRVHWGANYVAHKDYANIAYRLAYNHKENQATHSVGFEGKCYNAEVYYKAHVDVEHKTDGDADAGHKASFNLYQEHKVNSELSYKYRVWVNMMNPSDYKWGAVFTQNV